VTGHAELRRLTVVTLGRVLCVGLVAALAAAAVRAGVGPGDDSWVWLAATVVVAGTVTATRQPLERLADRVAYGPGGDPYAVLTGFVQRIADTLAVDDVLPHVARTVTQAMRGDRGEVRLWLADGQRWRETWPVDARAQLDDDVDIALRHHGQQVGDIGLTLASHSLSDQDQELLSRLSSTAGLALSNVRLTFDLRRRLDESLELAASLEHSRQRLLRAAAEQTRRFSSLVDARVQSRLEATGAALDRVAAGDSTAISDARAESTAALAALRELAAGVFPPSLADRGLDNALDAYCGRYDGKVVWGRIGPEPSVRAPLSTEAAAYFCVVQVVEDAVQDGPVRLELEQDASVLRLCAATANRLPSDTLQLLRDRVEATAGQLRQSELEPPKPEACSLTLTWPVGGSENPPALALSGSGGVG
jgi:hypothetical protein